MDGVEYAVCGIGINIGKRYEGEFCDTACAVDANRTLLAARITDKFFEGYDVFLKEGVKPFLPGLCSGTLFPAWLP
jgi:biotin-(acetyl-CoA carboxylase) ligase